MSPLPPGTTVDRYAIELELGSGGNAVVYRARHVHIGSSHAIKVVHTGAANVRDRLLREARLQGAMRHPNVVSVTDTVEVGGDVALVLEFVDGPTLADVLAAGRLDLGRADALARQVLAGAAAAHALGLVHRDLKPGNVLLGLREDALVAKIADFGLAKALDTGARGPLDTGTGVAMGTPPYMAPEQVRDARSVDARADVFSLGAVLYEMVTGRRAFPGADHFEIFRRIVAGDCTPAEELVPDLPKRMRRAIARALAVNPEERFADAGALLEAWEDGTTAPTPTWPTDAWRALAEARLGTGAAPPKRSDTTFAIPSHVGVPSTGVAQAPPSSLPDPLATALLAALLTGPFAMAVLAGTFGGVQAALDAAGGWIAAVLGATMLAAAGLGAIAARHRSPAPTVVGVWLMLPIGVALVAAIGTGALAGGTLASLDGSPAYERGAAATAGVERALSLCVSGLACATLLALAIAAYGVSRHRTAVGAAPWDRRRAATALAVALVGGAALWGAAATRADGGRAPVAVFGVLCASSLAIAAVATRGAAAPAPCTTKILVTSSSTLATGLAATAGAVRGQLHSFENLAAHAPSERLRALDSMSAVLDDQGAAYVAGWTLVALGAAASALVGCARPPVASLRPREQMGWLAACGLVILAVIVPGRRPIAALSASVVPAYVAQAGRSTLGIELVAEDAVVRDPGDTELRVGDRLIAAQGRPVQGARDLVQRTSDCLCGAGARCDLPGPCLEPGAAVELTVVRQVDGRPSLARVTVPVRSPP